MAFNPKYSSIPMVSNDLGINDLPIVFPNGETISQSGQGSTFTDLKAVKKGGSQTPSLILPNTRYSLSIDDNLTLKWITFGRRLCRSRLNHQSTTRMDGAR